MPAKENFSAYVRVGGGCLPEYKVEVSDDEQTVTCWIPSEAGKVFDICVHDTLRTQHSGVKTSVDGVKCPEAMLIYPRLSLTQEMGACSPSSIIQGFRKSANTLQPFVFSPCILVEGDVEGGINPAQLGEIKVDIWSAIPNGPRYTPDFADFASSTLRPLEVNERAKKGIVHGIQLGEQVTTPQTQFCQASWTKRIVTFVFKYRPIDVLRANGVTPLDAKTQQENHDDDIIDLTLEDDEEAQDDEVEKEMRRINKRLAVLKRMKREKKRKRDVSDQGIKREIKHEIDLT